MKVYDDGSASLYHGDARDMHFIPDESVDFIMTSPPYYSARKYGGGADMVWLHPEGEQLHPNCEHVWGEFKRHGQSGGKKSAMVQIKGQENFQIVPDSQQAFCQLCGAWRGQLGLEPTLDLYIAHLMQIFDECWRVLKGGVMVVNLGDSYAGSGGAGGDYNTGGLKAGQPKYPGAKATRKGGGVMVVNLGDSYAGSGKGPSKSLNKEHHHLPEHSGVVSPGLKPLDLCMVPSRVALALQERGWYLRSAIPWIKRASMPSSEKGDRWERCRVKVEDSTRIPEGYYAASHVSGPQSMGLHSAGREGRTPAKAKYADCPGCPKCLPNDGLVLRHGNWRPGKSLEWLFILSKTGDYYSDSEGVRIGLETNEKRTNRIVYDGKSESTSTFLPPNPAGRNRREMDWFYESLDDLISHHEREARRLTHLREQGGLMWEGNEPLAMLLNPKGYKEAHFATYPMALVEPFIKAYTSEKGYCPECGEPWVRVVERLHKTSTEQRQRLERSEGKVLDVTQKLQGVQGIHRIAGDASYSPRNATLGWRPTCTCEAARLLSEHPWLFPRTKKARKAKAQDHSTWLTWLERVYNRIHRVSAHELAAEPAIVLDPFIGSGTTCAAATKLGRKSIGVECVEEYLQLAIKRLGGGFAVEVDGVEVEQTQMFTEADT